MSKTNRLTQTAYELRLDVLEMAYTAGSGHIGGSFSSAELIACLYEEILQTTPALETSRDRFVLSKGHAAPALYAMLARKGFLPMEELLTLRDVGSRLQGHPCMFKLPGVEISTGSLGMGISVGLGMALAAKSLNLPSQIYVLCGDGELQEGQNWEGFMAMAKWHPDNLTIVIDRNHVQLDGVEEDIMPLGNLEEKIKAFGLPVLQCNGHDVVSILQCFHAAKELRDPKVIIAETIKGKGVSFMEGQSQWHGKPVNNEEYGKAKAELKEAFVW